VETVNSAKQLLQSPQIRKYLPHGCGWWPNYIYHFSHVTNIASILNDDLLRCRNQVREIKGEYLNDNASGDVILGTEEEYKNFVRFYFRPLTPTQYHNEGIRARNEITSLDAHCPVPIFLLFDTVLLDDPNVEFSYESLASHYKVPLYKGIQGLAEAPFQFIYHNESTYNLDGTQIRKHRQAEVVVKNQCDLQYLKKIVCRTKAEAETLKSLLNDNTHFKYSDKICVIDEGTFDTLDKSTMFYSDYLYILEVKQSKENLVVVFNKIDYNFRDIKIHWYDKNEKAICQFIHNDYVFANNKTGPELRINMNDFLINHNLVKVVLELDDSLVYSNDFELN
jgi:ssDNA thymidine ADP-ribosyltransferase, DarT